MLVNFIRKCQAIFQSCYTILCFLRQYIRVPFAVHLGQYFVLFGFFFHFSHSSKQIVASYLLKGISFLLWSIAQILWLKTTLRFIYKSGIHKRLCISRSMHICIFLVGLEDRYSLFKLFSQSIPPSTQGISVNILWQLKWPS